MIKEQDPTCCEYPKYGGTFTPIDKEIAVFKKSYLANFK